MQLGSGSRLPEIVALQQVGAEQPPLLIEVYKSPTCGCCNKWVEHLRAHGFTVRATDTAAVDELKAKHGVPRALRSCHTALVSGYVIEGHVPASDVERLLRERPAAAGLAVPGMPTDWAESDVGKKLLVWSIALQPSMVPEPPVATRVKVKT